MSNLARRTLRTTAAAAGMAALGVGLAGNALAASSVPEPEQATGPEPALPALPGLSTENPLASLPGVPAGPALPMLFVFQGPTVHSPTINTAGPSSPDALRLPVAAPVNTSASAAPQSAQSAQSTRSTEPAEPTEPGSTRAQAGPAQAALAGPGADQVSALSGLDSANLFDDLASESVVDQRGLGTSMLGINSLG
jgi:hypothetical protein